MTDLHMLLALVGSALFWVGLIGHGITKRWSFIGLSLVGVLLTFVVVA